MVIFVYVVLVFGVMLMQYIFLLDVVDWVQICIVFLNWVYYEVEVEMWFLKLGMDLLEVCMSWVLFGWYWLYDFVCNVYLLCVIDGEGWSLEVEWVDLYGWCIVGYDGVVMVCYIVYGDFIFGMYLLFDVMYVKINLLLVFFWVLGFEECLIEFCVE